MEKFLNPSHPVRCILTGPSECGKSVLLTNSILNNINEYDKTIIYSPSLHQDLYQKLIKCIVIDEIVNKKDFEKCNTEI